MLEFPSAITELDFSLMRLAQSWESALLTQVMLAITFLGNPLFWLLVIAVVCWQGKEKESFYLAAITLFSAILVGILKPIFARQRPSSELFKRLTADLEGPLSFPSGHSTLAAAYWSYFLHYLRKKHAILLFIVVALVAFSRIYLGAHFFSDVIAGIIAGIIIGQIIFYLRENAELHHIRASKPMGLIAIVIIISTTILASLLLENLPIAAALLGFFAGHFLRNEIGFNAPILKGRQLIMKEMYGFAVIGLVFIAMPYLAALQLPVGWGEVGQTRVFISYAFIGLWVSFLWPVLHQKILKGLQIKFN